MTNSTNITTVLNATIKATKEVIPLNMEVGKPTLITSPIHSKEYATLVGVTGDLRGRIIIESTKSILQQVAESMFGMQVEGEMLTSFFGELGNMISGSVCTLSAKEGVTLDITPPTNMVGAVDITGFSKAIRLPLNFQDGHMYITLALEG